MCLKCHGKSKNKKIVLSDKGTSTQLTVDNEEALETIHKLIDGCIIKEGERCDHYLKITNGDNVSHLFVELKGSDVEKAAKQIVTTIKSGCVTLNKSDKKHAAIVSTRNPLNSTETAKIKKKMLAQEKTHLHFYKMKAQEKISKFS
ncbi:hypothetical protein CAL61_00530 [Enterobacter hormaechei]|uniref:hypothetical protein n=1 Tax=Enterobacter hormaechei TaxID=158836 RepID=UPI000D733017|nr:hypothetical protein [Enterobacter hormaechei]AWQ41547.1 hypothetical protein BET69_00530 [Enterobacter hormaechei]AWQ55764.1 hypothetical protein CAL61_00530 [Enterobacter hormaechei]